MELPLLSGSLSAAPRCAQRMAPLVNGQLSGVFSGGPHPQPPSVECVLLEEQPYILSRFVELESAAGDVEAGG